MHPKESDAVKFLVVRLKGIEDLIFLGRDKLYRCDNVFFTATIAAEFSVIWYTKTKGELGKGRYITLLGDGTIHFTDEQRPNHIPIIDVEEMKECRTVEEWLK